MKLLQLFDDMEIEVTGGNIKDSLKKYLDDNDPQEVMTHLLYWLGGRGYNQYLDYALFAAKLCSYIRDIPYTFIKKDCGETLYELNTKLCHYLLFDDRHDMYQNVPYTLEKIMKIADDDNMAYKISVMIIDCFNTTGKIDYFTKILETRED